MEAVKKKEAEEREKAAQRYTRTEYKCAAWPLACRRRCHPAACVCAPDCVVFSGDWPAFADCKCHALIAVRPLCVS